MWEHSCWKSGHLRCSLSIKRDCTRASEVVVGSNDLFIIAKGSNREIDQDGMILSSGSARQAREIICSYGDLFDNEKYGQSLRRDTFHRTNLPFRAEQVEEHRVGSTESESIIVKRKWALIFHSTFLNQRRSTSSLLRDPWSDKCDYTWTKRRNLSRFVYNTLLIVELQNSTSIIARNGNRMEAQLLNTNKILYTLD